MSEFGLYLLIGLTAGGLSCMALQGGLITSLVAQDESETSLSSKGKLLTLFLATRFISYLVLGFLLGLIGSVLRLSDTIALLFQVLASVFMIATAMNLLNVHPIFRYLALQPPSFVRRWAKRATGRSDWIAPIFLGLMTLLLPCGVTQAVELLAINSGSATEGALIVGAFILGTTPLLAGYGLAASFAQARFDRYFRVVAASLLIFIGIISLNGVLVVNNSPVTLQKIGNLFQSEPEITQADSPVISGTQQITITITNSGYRPSHFRVKQGLPLKLTLQSHDAYSCALAFRLPEFSISTFLEATDSQSFLLTPTKKGKYTYTCSMGMYSGVMEVI